MTAQPPRWRFPLSVYGEGQGGGVSSLRPGHYPVIVADPPWDFVTYSDKGQGKCAQQHYPTMSVDEIAALPVSEIAADDCILLLWATGPNLPNCILTGIKWGFSWVTIGFPWFKRSLNGKSWHMGLGYYTRANSEYCLLMKRGNPQRKSAGVQSLIVTDAGQDMLPGFHEALTDRVGRHSAKPETFYKRVEQLFDGPYLELFGRRERPGWTVLGNEIDDQDIRAALLCEIESLLVEDKP